MRIELTRRFKRWRHGRGFGIHSPFAYSFVKETLRQKLPYYAYELIDGIADGDTVVISGQSRLADGAAVEVMQ